MNYLDKNILVSAPVAFSEDSVVTKIIFSINIKLLIATWLVDGGPIGKSDEESWQVHHILQHPYHLSSQYYAP